MDFILSFSPFFCSATHASSEIPVILTFLIHPDALLLVTHGGHLLLLVMAPDGQDKDGIALDSTTKMMALYGNGHQQFCT